MASGQVLLTRCEPRPAAPDTLGESEIWKVKVNTDASFYRACVTWLDPGGAGGKEIVKRCKSQKKKIGCKRYVFFLKLVQIECGKDFKFYGIFYTPDICTY